MNDLTSRQKDRIRVRDGERCLRCGRRPATIQHRKAKGMGGRGSKADPLTCADGVLLCLDCNVEAENSIQEECYLNGWKLRETAQHASRDIPYLDKVTGIWWLPDEHGTRSFVTKEWAHKRIRDALGR